VFGVRCVLYEIAQRGQICVWTADSRGVLTPTRQYRKKGEITTAVFCILPARTEAQRKAELKQSYSPAFFFGTDKGNLVYADDLGHCTDVQQLSASIDTMLFFEERSRLVIITRAFLLTQYQVADDGRVSRVMQVKMSIAGDVDKKGLKSVIWASPGLLAAASQEKMVRLLDIAADESYNLSLSACGEILDRSDRVATVAFGPLDRYLAVGTEMGLVAVWKYNGPLRDVSGARSTVLATSASDWEVCVRVCVHSWVLFIFST
jgi:intraflagellar transport protein 140